MAIIKINIKDDSGGIHKLINCKEFIISDISIESINDETLPKKITLSITSTGEKLEPEDIFTELL